MSMNWTMKDLLRRLKTQHVTANQVIVGDVVMVNDTCWEVASTNKEPNDFITILDKDGNGFINIPPYEVCIIIHRNALLY